MSSVWRCKNRNGKKRILISFEWIACFCSFHFCIESLASECVCLLWRYHCYCVKGTIFCWTGVFLFQSKRCLVIFAWGIVRLLLKQVGNKNTYAQVCESVVFHHSLPMRMLTLQQIGWNNASLKVLAFLIQWFTKFIFSRLPWKQWRVLRIKK